MRAPREGRGGGNAGRGKAPARWRKIRVRVRSCRSWPGTAFRLGWARTRMDSGGGPGKGRDPGAAAGSAASPPHRGWSPDSEGLPDQNGQGPGWPPSRREGPGGRLPQDGIAVLGAAAAGRCTAGTEPLTCSGAKRAGPRGAASQTTHTRHAPSRRRGPKPAGSETVFGGLGLKLFCSRGKSSPIY